jgi:hypothetical protein
MRPNSKHSDEFVCKEDLAWASVSLSSSLTVVDLRKCKRALSSLTDFGGNVTIKKVYLPPDTGFILIGSFAQCPSLELVDMSGCTSMSRISTYAFEGSGAKSGLVVNLPPNLVIVDEHAFSGSTIRFAVIPASVTTVCAYAFNMCKHLRSIEFLGKTAPNIHKSAFNDTPVVIFSFKKTLEGLDDDKWKIYTRKNLKKRAMDKSILISRLADIHYFVDMHERATLCLKGGVKDGELKKCRNNKKKMMQMGGRFPVVPVEIWHLIFSMACGWGILGSGRACALPTWTSKWRAEYCIRELRIKPVYPPAWNFLQGCTRHELECLCVLQDCWTESVWRVPALSQKLAKKVFGGRSLIHVPLSEQIAFVEWARRIIRSISV